MAETTLNPEAQQKLFRLLRDAEDGKPDALRVYLDTYSPHVTNDLLCRIAERATPTHQSWYVWFCLSILTFATVCIVSDLLEGKGLWESVRPMLQMLWPGFMLIGSLVKWAYRKGRAAVLHLADRNDLRALPLLLAEWQTHPFPTRRRWNNQVADALGRLLDEAQQEPLSLDLQDKLQKTVKRFVSAQPDWLRFGSRPVDLSATNAYLAVAILRRLHAASGPDNRDLLERVASDTRDLPPHRAFVRDVAQSLLPPQTTPATTPAPAIQTTVAGGTVATVQTLRRP